jgi:hypothetical protein
MPKTIRTADDKANIRNRARDYLASGWGSDVHCEIDRGIAQRRNL